MRTILWENQYLKIEKVEGVISSAQAAFQEPARSYYLQVGRRKRGTLYGNPSFFASRNTFHGMVQYDALVLVSERGEVVAVPDVVAVGKFQGFLTQGRQCAIYLLSPKDSTAGARHVFAVRTSVEQKHDLEGVASMADNLQAGLNQQLRLIGIPVGLSLVMGLLLLGPFLGILPIVLLTVFFGVSYVAGRALIRGQLGKFPSRDVFANVLRKDGWDLP